MTHAFCVTVAQTGAPENQWRRSIRPASCRVLMIYPRFSASTFWNFSVACELVGARYPAAPLGLITVAAMLPPNYGTSGLSIATPRN